VRNSEFTLPCDMVVKALGQEVLHELLGAVPGLELTGDGRVVIDPATGATSVPRLFAGGDCQKDAGEEVVNAVEAGKTAARGIHQAIMNGASCGRCPSGRTEDLP
jgi:dihydropyrimidine dehydrogenase (NAD+) subunit PreT